MNHEQRSNKVIMDDLENQIYNLSAIQSSIWDKTFWPWEIQRIKKHINEEFWSAVWKSGQNQQGFCKEN